ncbi:MAG TPA: lytic transglycosylase domain-containing protein [Solirubrobacteraceae bacterium]|jgi:soluble lytic murein transglycosylase-like protein|nr:lytic transglycosylase domain-containing protein [Solirubrobacteraceae bacterium]
MSAQALGGISAGVTASELAASQRVQQLQSLIESARQVAAGGVLSTGAASTGTTATAGYSGSPATGADFASTLQAATTADAASATGAAGAYPSLVQGAAGSESASQYDALIEQAAARNGLDPAVLHGLIQQESDFNPSAGSSAGAQGLTQLMPGTASSLGVANPLDPAESIEGGARYLSQMMAKFGGNTEDALAAYNAGPGAVQQYGGIPPYAETQSYVANVLGYAETYRQSHPSTVTGALA